VSKGTLACCRGACYEAWADCLCEPAYVCCLVKSAGVLLHIQTPTCKYYLLKIQQDCAELWPWNLLANLY
jgi:hypothetical protein